MSGVIIKDESTEEFIQKVARDFNLDISDRQQYEYAEEIARRTEEITRRKYNE